jgi:hypothetical protein
VGRPEIAEKAGRLTARRNDVAALKALNLARLSVLFAEKRENSAARRRAWDGGELFWKFF